MAGTITLTLSFSENSSYANRKDITYIRTKNPDLQDLEIITDQNGAEIRNNGHEYVDLGLSSGTLWATMNVGATSPEDYGDYFAWGETEGDTEKTAWDWNTYKWCYVTGEHLTKYCSSSKYGVIDNKTELELEDDVAQQNWGGDWRIPSEQQIKELNSSCAFLWTTQNGINGYKVTSLKNGNSIFLPAAGWNKYLSRGSAARYWSRSRSYSNSSNAQILEFGSTYIRISNMVRCQGETVRPVLSK